MGKKTKKKLKWTNLEIETKTEKNHKTHDTEESKTHPFLKIISKNLDVILKKDSINTDTQDSSEETKFVYLYRSDQAIPVSNPADTSNYIGAPIQYTHKPTPRNIQKSQEKPNQDPHPPPQQTTQGGTMQEYHHSGLDTQYSVESNQSLGSVNWEDQVSPVQNQTVYYYQAPPPPVQYSEQPTPQNPYQTSKNQSEAMLNPTPTFTPPTTYTHQPPPSNHGLTAYPTYTEPPIYNPSDGTYCQPVVESTIPQPVTYVPQPTYVQPTLNPPPGLTTYTQATNHPNTTTTFTPRFIPQVPFPPNHPTTYIPNTHPVMFHPHLDPSQHQPLPIYLPTLPQELQNQNVQFVPYYYNYYYPVPIASQPVQAEAVEVPPNIPTEHPVYIESDITSSTCFCQNHEEDPMEACDPGSPHENPFPGNYCHAHIPLSHISASSSTTSCELIEKTGRTLKKRKKRRKQSGAEKKLNEDNDSGYLNGTESSKNCSDQEQEKIKILEENVENIKDVDVVIETISELGNLIAEEQKENSYPITDQFIEQIQNPTSEITTIETKSLEEQCQISETLSQPKIFDAEEEINEDFKVKGELEKSEIPASSISDQITDEPFVNDEKILPVEMNNESKIRQKTEKKSNKKELKELLELDPPKIDEKLNLEKHNLEAEKNITDNISPCLNLSYSAVCQKNQVDTETMEIKEEVVVVNIDSVSTYEEIKPINPVINTVSSTSEWKEVSVNKRLSGRKKNKNTQKATVNVPNVNCKKPQKEMMDIKKNENKDTKSTKKVQFEDKATPSTVKGKKMGKSKKILKTNETKNDNAAEPSNTLEEKILLNEKHQEDSNTKILPPLSDVKDIFWKEKEVEIIELKPEKSQKTSNKKKKSNKNNFNNKTISIIERQNKFLNESTRSNQETDQTLIRDLENLNLPMLVLRPTDSYTPTPQRTPAQYPRSCNKINCNSYCSMPIFPWHCVDESLINSKLGRRDYGQKPESDKKVILIRDQNPFKPPVKRDQGAQKYKKENVPGPRLQYSKGVRTGPLGVTRKVVPPLSLIHRLNSL